VAVDTFGSVYIADLANNCVRKIYTLNLSLEVSAPGIAGNSIVLAPNPNNGSFRISATLTAANDDAASIQVTDLAGRIIYSNSLQAQNGTINTQIKLPDVPDGMYVLSMQSGADVKVSSLLSINDLSRFYLAFRMYTIHPERFLCTCRIIYLAINFLHLALLHGKQSHQGSYRVVPAVHFIPVHPSKGVHGI